MIRFLLRSRNKCVLPSKKKKNKTFQPRTSEKTNLTKFHRKKNPQKRGGAMCGEKGIPHCVNILPNKNELSPFACHALQQKPHIVSAFAVQPFLEHSLVRVCAAFKDEAAKTIDQKYSKLHRTS